MYLSAVNISYSMHTIKKMEGNYKTALTEEDIKKRFTKLLIIHILQLSKSFVRAFLMSTHMFWCKNNNNRTIFCISPLPEDARSMPYAMQN